MVRNLFLQWRQLHIFSVDDSEPPVISDRRGKPVILKLHRHILFKNSFRQASVFIAEIQVGGKTAFRITIFFT